MMKKLISLLSVLTLVVVLTACEEEPAEQDTTKPVLAGVEDVTFYAGEENFDALKDVTATDDIDGDLTSSIKVIGSENVDSTKPGLYTVRYKVEDEDGNLAQVARMVAVLEDMGPVITGADNISAKPGELTAFDAMDGITVSDDRDEVALTDITVTGADTVDLATAGSYTVTYTVSDDHGNETVVQRVIAIVEEGGSILINGDFAAGESNWGHYFHNDSADGTVDYADGMATVAMTGFGGEEWSVQLEQLAINLEQGKFYKLEFKAKADIARSIGVKIEDPSNGYYNYTDQKFDLTTEWQTFTVDEISVAVATATGKLGFMLGNSGANPQITTVYIDDVVLKPVEASADTEAPVITTEDVTLEKDATFDVLDGVTITDNQDFDLTTADIVVGGDTVDTATPGTYTVTYTVTDASGNVSAEVSRTITVVALMFADTDLIPNGEFTDALAGWDKYTDGADFTYEITNEELAVTMTAKGDGLWRGQLFYAPINYKHGQTYKVVFKVKADVATTINAVAGNQLPADPWFTTYKSETIAVTTDYTEHEVMFTMSDNGLAEGRFKFEIGSGDHTTLTFDDIKVIELDEDETVANGDYEDHGYTTYVGNGDWAGWANASFDIIDGEMVVDVTEVGNQGWGVQFNSTEVTLEKDKTYRLTFDVKAENARYFEVKVSDGAGGWLAEGINATVGFVNEEYVFTYTGDTIDNAEIHFELGYYADFVDDNGTPDDASDDNYNVKSANGKVYLDNIKLEVQDETDNTVYTDTTQITNGTFDQAVNWNVGANDGAALSANVVDGVLEATVTALGPNSYSAEIYQDGLTFKTGRTYQVEFDVKADAATTLLVALFETGNWTSLMGDNYEKHQVDITDTENFTHVSFTFEMTKDTLSNGKVAFEFGNIVDNNGTDDDASDDTVLSQLTKVYIDNLVVYPVLD